MVCGLVELQRFMLGRRISPHQKDEYSALYAELGKEGLHEFVEPKGHRYTDYHRIRLIMADALERRIGSVTCPQCEKQMEAHAVKVTRFRTDVDKPLQGGGGRNFHGPCGHELLGIVDFRA